MNKTRTGRKRMTPSKDKRGLAMKQKHLGLNKKTKLESGIGVFVCLFCDSVIYFMFIDITGIDVRDCL